MKEMRGVRRGFRGRWRAFLPVLVLLLVQGVAAQGPPTPPVEVPFDVVTTGATAEVTISVTERRPYHLNLNLYYAGDQDFRKVRQLAGDGTKSRDGRYAEPGVPVMIRVRVTEEGNSQPSGKHYENTRETQGHDRHGFVGAKGGYFVRPIGGVVLGPGRYRVWAEVVEGAPDLRGIETRLSVTYDPRFRPLRD